MRKPEIKILRFKTANGWVAVKRLVLPPQPKPIFSTFQCAIGNSLIKANSVPELERKIGEAISKGITEPFRSAGWKIL